MSELAVQNEALEQEIMPSFNFLLEGESEKNALLAEQRAWLKGIRRERPLPKNHHRVAVYIRYFNQTRYEDYLSAHKKQFLDTLALCPNWEFTGFYVDEGSSAPNMESAPEWARLRKQGRSGHYPESEQYLQEAIRALLLCPAPGGATQPGGHLLCFRRYLYSGFLLQGGSTRPVFFARSGLEDTPR